MADIPVVADFMDRQFIKFKPEMNVGEALKILLKRRLIGVCVVDEEDRLLGILSEKDCLKFIVQDVFYKAPKGTVGQYYHEVTMTVPPTMDIIKATQIFMKHDFRRLAVIKEGKLVGQITRRDILRGLNEFDKKFNYQSS